MSKIEKSVQDLAVALDELSVRVEKTLLANAESGESLASAKAQAALAQQHAGKAGRDLKGIIDDLRDLLDQAPGPATDKTGE